MKTLLALVCLVFPLTSLAEANKAVDLDSRRKALDSLLQEQWEYVLRTNPEYASTLGDKRYNDRLRDFSQAFIDSDLRATADFLRRFEAIDTTGFPVQEQLNRRLMIRDLRLELEGARFKQWEMPVRQNGGVHLAIPRSVRVWSFETVKDYEDYLSRLRQVPRLFDETMVQMRNGMRDGLMPPRFLLGKIAGQCKEIAETKPEQSPLAQPLTKFPASFSEPDRKRLREAILEAIRKDVNPAYRKLEAFVRKEYEPKGRTEVGVWSLPDGEARYAYDVKLLTTSDLTPDQIHELGLSEVKRIEGEMVEVAHRLGFKDLKSLNGSIPKNPSLHFSSRQQILDLYSKYISEMEAKLPRLFVRIPKARVTVLPVEKFEEKQASAARYVEANPDGSRPGHVEVNTGDYEKRLTLDVETTALHEGLPGHHLQIALAQELSGLPAFRRYGGYNAFDEGWALYAERLGREVGSFSDPYSYYGHLQGEIWRAIRLVVDTGLHSKKWTRQQVVDYFHAHSAIDEANVQSETDRYIAGPGQALGYKVGQLKILELRERAKQQLGAKFDVRAFHDQVLGAGALPLDVLEEQVQAWIAAPKS